MENSDSQILIVDDEATIRDILFQKMTIEGYQCDTAAHVDEAIEKIKQHEFALILSDINMPGKSGIDLLGAIRKLAPDTAVIMATAVHDVNTAMEAMRMGAYDYVLKPFNLDGVSLSVERALEKRRLILENREYQHHLEERVEEQTRQIREIFLSAIKSLVQALEAKDEYTSGHSRRVAEIAVAIAHELGLSEETIEKIRLGALLHDIGKIGVREIVLNKPGRLTNEEYQHVIVHPQLGERILWPVIKDEVVINMVKYHHEAWDGSGYPEGLRGEEIPPSARILAVADSYDAMASSRPYREAMTPEQVRAEIERDKQRYDTTVVEAFFRVQARFKALEELSLSNA